MATAARTPRLVHFVYLHLGVSHVKQLQQVLPPRVCVCGRVGEWVKVGVVFVCVKVP
jgi:hypothetical protein